VLASCVNPARFHALERDVAQLGPGGPREERRIELDVQLAALRDELAALRGELQEVRRHADEALSNAEDARRIRVARRQAEEGRSGEIPLIPAPARRPSDTEREVREYEAAYRLYGESDCRAAMRSFQAFMQTYPQSEYADNALFWMGECHQQLGDLALAAITFQRVHEQFPQGNKVPDALYRQAVALVELGRQRGESRTYASAAREVLERIVREFPRSECAAQARRLLEKLGS
jgi:tol-pal system protein YbgF